MDTLRWLVGIFVVWTLPFLIGCDARERPASAAENPEASLIAERVAGNLQEPVALVFLSPTQWLVAERRSGRIRWIEDDTLRRQPFATVAVPNPSGYHEYGLLGLAVHPAYPNPPYVYAFHTVAGANNRPAGQRIVRFTVQNGRGVNPQTIVGNLPAGANCCHNGGRIAFGPDGKLYVTLGDTQRPELAQEFDALPGKILRYNSDGSIPSDNPNEQQRTSWAGTEGDRPMQTSGSKTPVYAIGFRNPFGLTFSPLSGEMYVTDNGPDRADELNRVIASDNYGWPQVMGRADDPHYHDPIWSSGNTAVAPTGLAFYSGDEIPAYRGDLFFAAYNDGKLRRANFDNEGRMTAVSVVEVAGNRAKLDVAMGPDGFLYFTSLDAIYRLRLQ
jgi:quinoprotein glucose dehydrogenase